MQLDVNECHDSKTAYESLTQLGAFSLNDYFKRDRLNYEFIYQYPPSPTMENIFVRDIFIDGKKEEKKDLVLYIHIPFCTRICSYCNYFKFAGISRKLVEKFIYYLDKELDLLSEKLNLSDSEVKAVYFGGGTPSYLSENLIQNLMSSLHEKLNFTKNCEMTFEANPESLSQRKLDILLQNGFTRVSLGVQTLDDNLLSKYCERLHTAEKALEVMKYCLDSDLQDLNVDLIYGLPTQNFSQWNESLEKILELKPEYVSAFHLRIIPGTKYYSMHENLFPGIEENLVMHEMAIEKFTQNGYTQILENQFMLPGRKFKYQEHKWTSNELLALGPTGYSFINNCIYFNQRSIENYFYLLDKNKLPVSSGKKLNNEELMRRKVVLGTKLNGVNRQDSGIDKNEFKKLFELTVEEKFSEEIKKLNELDLVKDNTNYLALNHRGILYLNEICRIFYSDTSKIALSNLDISGQETIQSQIEMLEQAKLQTNY